MSIPVPVTTPSPRPYVTFVLENTMLFRSPIPTSPSIISVSFSEATDSPVKAASSACNEFASIKRISAGTTLPASSKTISPGTISVLFIT